MELLLFPHPAPCSCSKAPRRRWQPHTIPAQPSCRIPCTSVWQRCPHSSQSQLATGRNRQWSPSAVKEPDEHGDHESDSVDIDKLARQLSSSAARMRDSMSEEDLHQQNAESSDSADSGRRGPFGWETTPAGTSVVDTLGDGGFTPDDLELQQQLGQLSWVTERAQENPLQVSRQGNERMAILLFLATYYSKQAYQGTVKVLLKEFLPGASAVAVNEVQILTHLQPLPHMPWQAARGALSSDPPFVSLLESAVAWIEQHCSILLAKEHTSRLNIACYPCLKGYFRSSPSAAGRRVMTSIAEEDNNSKELAVWLVYKWEALQPLSHYAAAAQNPQGPGLFARRLGGLLGSQTSGTDPAQEALRRRCAMVRSIAKGAVAAVAYCHERDVVHGSLGAGSLLLNTFDDVRWQDLVVKLDNFGFARQSSAAGRENPSALGQREDLQALGMVILELVFAALAEGSAATGPALQRLLMDVFASDTQAFRKYCLNEVDWSVPTIMLDEFDGAGWQLIGDLITGSRSAKELQQNLFCCIRS